MLEIVLEAIRSTSGVIKSVVKHFVMNTAKNIFCCIIDFFRNGLLHVDVVRYSFMNFIYTWHLICMYKVDFRRCQ